MYKVLFIEDNKDLLWVLLSMAKKINPNLEYIGVGTIAEAREVLDKNEFEAFFIDVHLTDGNGVEFAKEIREMDGYVTKPMVYITADASMKDKAFEDSNFYEYVIKSRSDKLDEVFEKILVRHMGAVTKMNCLILENKKKKQFIKYDDIVLIESINRRIFITTKADKFDYKCMTLTAFLESTDVKYVQVHRSFAINKKYLKEADFNTNSLELDYVDRKIDIGATFKRNI